MATIYLNNGKAPVTQDGKIVLGDCCCDKSACCDIECRLWMRDVSQISNFGSDTRGYHRMIADIDTVGMSGLSAAGCGRVYAESNTQAWSEIGEQNYGIVHLGTDCASCTGSQSACGRGHAVTMGRSSSSVVSCGGVSHTRSEWGGDDPYADARVRLVYAAPGWVAAKSTLATLRYTNNRRFTTPSSTTAFFRGGVKIVSLPSGASGVRVVGRMHGNDSSSFVPWVKYDISKTATGYMLVDSLYNPPRTETWTSSDSTIGVYWGDGALLHPDSNALTQWAGMSLYDPVCEMTIAII